ncbi:MAG: DUF3598 family protein [Microcystaceae cyanobacterium]
MLTKWECFLKNLGEWRGSFARLSPKGEFMEDIPTVVSFEALNNNTLIHQKVHRFPPNQPPQLQAYNYSSLNKSIQFFENGAFSQGSMQWGPFSEFGAELGLIEEDRRLRLVQMYDKESQLSVLTLIREKLTNSSTPERPTLTLDQLLGTWSGEAVTVYPDLQSPDTFNSQLTLKQIEKNKVEQTLSFGQQTLQSQARIEENCLYFEQGEMTIQICLLADGASSNCPLIIKPRQGFVLELGWLLSPNQRQRIIRRYNNKGEWISLTLVKETKIS